MKQKRNLIILTVGICFMLSGCASIFVEQAENIIPVQCPAPQDDTSLKERETALPQEEPAPADGPVHLLIERKISHDLALEPVLQGDPIFQNPKVLAAFYSRQAWRPVWFQNGTPLPSIAKLLEVIAKAEDEGLSPHDYHYDTITNIFCSAKESSSPLPTELIADLDILLTDAYQSYASHLLWGKSKRGKEFAQSSTANGDIPQPPFLEKIPEASQLEEAFASFIPPHPEYARLKQVLIRYRQIEAEEGWPVITGKTLAKGSKGDHVASLKKRLHLTGELEEIIPEHENHFDAELEHAVRLFQKTHKLKENGIANAETLKLMNVPVAKRIQQLRLDMERWRWMPRDLDRYILVDIPDFSMKVIEDGKTALQMKTVVGKTKHPTPTFSGRMSTIELNPHWNVPVSIIRNEIVPETKRDPSYIARHRIKIYQDWRHKSQEILPEDIEWDKINAQKFSYRLVQDPGAHNSLGRVKFLFPNVHDIYMHDTPSRSLFKRKERAFSHGCIRLEHPVDLAEHLLKDDHHWNRKQIQKMIGTGKHTRIALKNPIPVYITYFLVEVDDSGYPYFRKDFYEYNRLLEKEMNRPSKFKGNK